MKPNKPSKPSLDDQILDLVHKAEDGSVDEMTWIQTAESMFDANPKATNPWSFLRRLQRDRRRQMDVVFKSLRKVGYLSRDIRMIKTCFNEIGADKNGRK